MTAPAQALLADLLADRVEWVTGRRQGEPDADTQGTTVLVLLRSLDLADLVHGARAFAATLDPDEAEAWRRSWTRTRFLFGNPANLPARNRPRVVAPNATAAWLGPFPTDRRLGLSRLLKPVTGVLPRPPIDLDLPGSGRRHLLHVAVDGLTLVDYLVHLHHTLVEAVLLGRLRPDDPLWLSHRPALTSERAGDRPAYARVLPDPRDAARLRPYTWLAAA
ncbi:MAG: hypothetical protein GEV28_22900 [Actinophytocola sp.]|uniref:DUF6182 family protein n=1 Tax=Actinophytocola sp. TaxID=1872138 RepID=UPI00132A637A|nr:DUF6182 family protein [Actinophytocola sp.]MPZ83082.1 hypothetical protein [Actinophytocola sp.]